MDTNLKGLLLFTALYGAVALGLMSMLPSAAALRIADGVGNFEADPANSISLAMLRAE
jgi:hypothetical protein